MQINNNTATPNFEGLYKVKCLGYKNTIEMKKMLRTIDGSYKTYLHKMPNKRDSYFIALPDKSQERKLANFLIDHDENFEYKYYDVDVVPEQLRHAEDCAKKIENGKYFNSPVLKTVEGFKSFFRITTHTDKLEKRAERDTKHLPEILKPFNMTVPDNYKTTSAGVIMMKNVGNYGEILISPENKNKFRYMSMTPKLSTSASKTETYMITNTQNIFKVDDVKLFWDKFRDATEHFKKSTKLVTGD